MTFRSQLNAFNAELEDVTSQLEKLQTNLDDLRAQKTEATAAIMRARSRCDQYTKSDIFRLRGLFRSGRSIADRFRSAYDL